ncbi:MAG: redoxin domain-containing protein [Bradyrhizobiaceae bacterium]|nr:redoxin domain-containing protein [Bradyrhizobiaceae bacterium]
MNTLLRTTVSILLIVGTAAPVMTQEHEQRSYPARVQRTMPLPNHDVLAGKRRVDLTSASMQHPIIIVRYLGFSCVHCVEQLAYLNRYARRLQQLGIRVYAVSADDERTNTLHQQRMNYDTSVLTLLTDTNNGFAKLLGAKQRLDNKSLNLHASMVVYKGIVQFITLTDEPYLDLEHLVSVAADHATPHAQGMPTSTSHPADRYLNNNVRSTIVAGPAEGINAPMDLDFNHSPLNPHDLWVVLTSNPGNAIAILHNAIDSAHRSVTIKKDSRASHFMWRTHAIAMGSNGTFATAQNGAPGNHNPFYQFMGPTLWSADTAVFASRYQSDSRILASHLDMLHQSPQNLGIAHDSANVYWVSDAYYKDITRYDFKDPHEVGGTDHRDGVIRRYADATVSGGQLGEPGHIALDKSTGMLYIVDPGANIVTRLNTRTGSFVRNLVAPEESTEPLAEYSEWKGAMVDTVINTGLVEPVGIEVSGNRLFVGDRSSGLIHVFAITPDGVDPLGTIPTGATELLGICYGPDNRLWFVDRATSTVGRLDTEADSYLQARTDVVVTDIQANVDFDYHNQSPLPHTASTVAYIRTQTADGTSDWTALPYESEVTIAVATTQMLSVTLTLPDSLHAFEVELRERMSDGTEGIRARTTLVPRSITKAVVDDALMEVFRITEAVDMTDRVGYVSLRSDVFVRTAHLLPNLQVVLWNGGSFGEISVTDDAVIQGLLDRGVELMLVADDPLLLRTDLPGSTLFFSRFGARLRGADQVPSDNGQRLFLGDARDPITFDMKQVLCTLPRLDHHRGAFYVPDVVVTSVSDSTHAALRASHDTSSIVCTRYTVNEQRTVLLSINAARFRDGKQRTTVLDRSLEWLEGAVVPDTADTTDPTSVHEYLVKPSPTISIAGNVTSSTCMASIVGYASEIDVALYSLAGQRLADLYHGELSGERTIPINVSTLANGTYFVIVRNEDHVTYQTVVKQ